MPPSIGARQNVKGAAAVVIGVFLIAVSDNIIFYISQQHGLWQFLVCRGMVCIVALTALASVLDKPLLPTAIYPSLLRSFLHVLTLALYYISLIIMPIAEAGAAFYTNPLMILIISVVLFNEPFRIERLIAVIAGLIGIYLILDPESEGFRPLNFIVLGAALSYALAAIVTHRYCAQESTYSLLFLLAFVSLMFGLAGVLFIHLWSPSPMLIAEHPFILGPWKDGTVSFWLAVGAQSTVWLCACFALIRGYQLAEASLASIFEYSYLIFVGIISWILWYQQLSAASIAGIALIIAAGTLAVYRPRLSRQ